MMEYYSLRPAAKDEYISLSDARVVKELIRGRSYHDSCYRMRTFPDSLLGASSEFHANEGLICAYIDQDRIIKGAGLSPTQDRIVKLLMRGWRETDIAEKYNCSVAAVSIQLSRAVDKIVQENIRQWCEFAKQRIKDKC